MSDPRALFIVEKVATRTENIGYLVPQNTILGTYTWIGSG